MFFSMSDTFAQHSTYPSTSPSSSSELIAGFFLLCQCYQWKHVCLWADILWHGFHWGDYLFHSTSTLLSIWNGYWFTTKTHLSEESDWFASWSDELSSSLFVEAVSCWNLLKVKNKNKEITFFPWQLSQPSLTLSWTFLFWIFWSGS